MMSIVMYSEETSNNNVARTGAHLCQLTKSEYVAIWPRPRCNGKEQRQAIEHKINCI